jgi:hypothetical protein
MTRGHKAFLLLLENYNNLLIFRKYAEGEMLMQLSLRFEDEWWMKVCDSLSEDQKQAATDALKEMLVASIEMGRGGLKNGELED